MKKSKIKKPGGILGTHLDLIKSITSKDSPNTLSKKNLIKMDYKKVMAHFVHADKSVKLKEIKKEIAEKRLKLKNIFKSAAGTNIADTYLENMNREIVDDGTWADNEYDDEEE